MICPRCSTGFEPRYHHQVYCTRKCGCRQVAAKYRRKTRHRNAQYIREDKQRRGCNRCPERRVPCLDYHHVDRATKTDIINRMMESSFPRFKAELAKCELLCANCHRVEEASRRKMAA